MIRISRRLGLLALAYLLVLAGTYIYCELAEPPDIRVDQAAKPLLSPAERAALHPDTRAGLEAYEADDYTRAHTLWLPRAEAGDAEAMFGMGILYDRGEGIQGDDSVATHWYQRASTLGHPIANLNYGYALSHGIGVRKDFQEAKKHYEKAASSEVAAAAYNLGKMAQNSKVDGDSHYEEKWFRTAAEQCHAGALLSLGVLHFDSHNNIKISYLLLSLSELNGNKESSISHFYYLFLLTPWDYIKIRSSSWTLQKTSCAQDRTIKLSNIR